MQIKTGQINNYVRNYKTTIHHWPDDNNHLHNDAGTGYMHESFHKDDATVFTRTWFAWQNTLFGELIIKLINDGKLGLLNCL